jgi:hypothetical protein
MGPEAALSRSEAISCNLFLARLEKAIAESARLFRQHLRSR